MEISHFSDNHGLKNGFLSANNMKRKNAQCGFSLIELIVVIAIMAVLVGLIAPQFVKTARNKREETCKHNREAILRVYERAVYDGSVKDILLDTVSVNKVMDGSYKPSYSEVKQYLNCPNRSGGGSHYFGYVMNGDGEKYDAASGGFVAQDSADNTGSACIYCEDCGNVVSIDLLGWSDAKHDDGGDPGRAEPTSTAEDPPEGPYTVDFDPDGGVPQPEAKSVEAGKTVPKPTTPKRGLDSFGGWYTAGGSLWDFDNDTVNSNMTLYAKWISGSKYGSAVWPYADDPSWWDATTIAQKHAGYYNPALSDFSYDTFATDARISIKVPTGVFQSKSGAYFVFVYRGTGTNACAGSDEAAHALFSGDVKGKTHAFGWSAPIKLYDASSPERYAASVSAEDLIQLTGNRYLLDITDLDDDETVLTSDLGAPSIHNGDLIEFFDNNTHQRYRYVYSSYGMNDGGHDETISKAGDIRAYYSCKAGNAYKVDVCPQSIE